MNRVGQLLVLMLTGWLVSCAGLKEVTSSDPLLMRNTIVYEGDVPAKAIRKRASKVLAPEPNGKFLWMRPKVARYHMISDSARTRKIWRNRVAEPILLSMSKPNRVGDVLQNFYFNHGFFENTITSDTIRHGKRKAEIVYIVRLNAPHLLSGWQFPKPTDPLTLAIEASAEGTLLQPGERYNLDLLKEERIRIDGFLKERGFFNFNEGFLVFKADTTAGNHEVDLKLNVKPMTPPESRQQYTIGDVLIHDDYALKEYKPDTTYFDRYRLISQDNPLDLRTLRRGIFFRPDRVVTRTDYLNTVRYFNSLPAVRYTNLQLSPSDQPNQLDAYIYLSPRKRFSFTTEVDATFRSTNYFGPGVVASFTDRNLRGGAELLRVNARGRFEIQVANGTVNPAYEVGIDAELELPRLYPAFLDRRQRSSLGTTRFSVGNNLFNRLDLYQLTSTYTDFSYRWSPAIGLEHQLKVMEVIFTRVPEDSKSDEFREYLEENPGVQRNFEEQFVIGAGYDFTYQSTSRGQDHFTLNAGVDMAGIALRGLFNLFGANQDSLGRYRILGIPFSQYGRLKVNMVYGLELSEGSSVVSRFFAGLGWPFANSLSLPYIKQFYAGGTNSLRSFVARSIGPGSEVPPEGFVDLAGDIRLEGNVEYRFTVSGNLKGAVFADAGNIWLWNKDDTRPNGHFRADEFLQELAVTAGWGLRLDFDFVVGRLDFAYTLRTPYLPKGERWATDINIWNPVINFALGYPF